jgi:hypothetical protein
VTKSLAYHARELITAVKFLKYRPMGPMPIFYELMNRHNKLACFFLASIFILV